jgi:hypothetical protein
VSPEPRRDFATPVRVRLRPAGGEERVEIAVNLSPGGLCLRVREPLDEGCPVELGLQVPPSGPAIEGAGRVVWVSRRAASGAAPRFWEVGIRFDGLAPALRRRIARWAGEPRDRRR